MVVFKPTFLFPDRLKTGVQRSRAPAGQVNTLFLTERFFRDVAWPATLMLEGNDLSAMERWLVLLEQTVAEVDDSLLATALLRHLVSATLLDIARRFRLGEVPAPISAEKRTRARVFEADVERSFRVTRSVKEYADHLSCSTVTLDRTSKAAFGLGAKAYIDARVVLEARRMLSHTTLSVAAISEELGFSEPTNFVKFFKSRTRELPGAFRDSLGD